MFLFSQKKSLLMSTFFASRRFIYLLALVLGFVFLGCAANDPLGPNEPEEPLVLTGLSGGRVVEITISRAELQLSGAAYIVSRGDFYVIRLDGEIISNGRITSVSGGQLTFTPSPNSPCPGTAFTGTRDNDSNTLSANIPLPGGANAEVVVSEGGAGSGGNRPGGGGGGGGGGSSGGGTQTPVIPTAPPELAGRWEDNQSWSVDGFIVEANRITYFFESPFFEMPTYAGTIRHVSIFSDSAGVIIIEYDPDRKPSYYDGLGNFGNPDYLLPLRGSFIGIYFRNLVPGVSVQMSKAFVDGGAEKPTLAEAIAAFTVGNEGTYIGFYGSYVWAN